MTKLVFKGDKDELKLFMRFLVDAERELEAQGLIPTVDEVMELVTKQLYADQ